MTGRQIAALLFGVGIICFGMCIWVTHAKAGECGKVSWYEQGYVTASGERFNPNGRTIAIWGVPFGTRLRVTDMRTKRSVIVRANDTGGFRRYGRIADLSRGAAEALGMIGRGVAYVCIERVG
jgi:rare lipoprotein A